MNGKLQEKLQFSWRKMAVTAVIALTALVACLTGGRALLAAISASGNIPESMTYQGILSNSGGPYTGTVEIIFSLYEAETGGSSIWQETHTGVPVNSGFFSVVLGSQGQPVAASLFSGSERWLQVSTDLGSGPVTLPRQRLHAVPYALQAYAANTALHADTADTVLNPPPYIGSPYENVLIVAKSGGDYTSIKSALDSITNATSTSPWLVWVAPGAYTEQDGLVIPGYVHLQGADATTTKIVAARQGSFDWSADGTIVQLNNYGKLSDITVENTSTTLNASAIVVQPGSTLATVIENVSAKVQGTGGTVHTAVNLREGVATIRNLTAIASGAGTFNTGLTSYFPDNSSLNRVADIETSNLRGEGVGTGYGMQLFFSLTRVTSSDIYGGYRGVYATGDGNAAVVRDSFLVVPLTLSGEPESVMFETQSFALLDIFGSELSFHNGDDSRRYTGNASLRCWDNYLRHPFYPYVMDALQDGTSSANACKVVP